MIIEVLPRFEKELKRLAKKYKKIKKVICFYAV